MAKIKLTKTAVDAAMPTDDDYELRDTIVPWFHAEGHTRRAEDLHAAVSD